MYARSAVLIIRIGVYDNISPFFDCMTQSCHVCFGQAYIRWVPYNVIYPMFSRYLISVIATSIIDNQPFNFVEPVNVPRKIS